MAPEMEPETMEPETMEPGTMQPGPTVPAAAEPRRLYQHIADQIRELIGSGRFPAGTRLPAERDLAHQFGVSRPSLREALIALEIHGHVEIRMGSGVYVSAASGRSLLGTAPLGESPTELMQARAALESCVAAQAAARITDAGLARLREALQGMRNGVGDSRAPVDNDRVFHLTIAEIAGNSVMQRMIGQLFDERHSPIATQLIVRAENVQTWRAALAEHEVIYQALEARDPLGAQSAMRAHLKSSEERWLGN